MKVVILAGGLGTRLQEETVVKPKPMVEIGGFPILWHIMKIYAAQGCKEFVIALGYKGQVIKEFFLNYYNLRNDISVDLGRGKVVVHEGKHEDWIVHLVDTGQTTETGGRLKRLQSWVGKEPFFMTYGDAVSDVNLAKLLAFHRQQNKIGTLTAVRPPARFGALRVQDHQVASFAEKPQAGEGWVNGGFFVFEPQIFDYIPDDNSVLERDPLERLVKEGQLNAYRHEGFWQCMDTLRELKFLEAAWQNKQAPWKLW